MGELAMIMSMPLGMLIWSTIIAIWVMSSDSRVPNVMCL